MTIYKTLQHDKKDDKSPEDPEVVMEPLTGGETGASVPKVVRVTYGPHHSRTYINLCLIIAALVVLGAGIVGAIFLYRHLSHRVTTGFCGVTYYDEYYHQQSDLLRGQDPLYIDLTRTDDDIDFKLDFLEEEVEVSEVDGYEKIHVPQFDECEDSIFLHDFHQNYTAIVDHPHASCYVIKLNRTLVAHPKDVTAVITGMKREEYQFPRAEVVRQKYTIVTPAMGDLKILGPFIMRECFLYDTYHLEKIVGGVFKRSARAPEELHVGFNTFKNTIMKMTIITRAH